MTTDQLVEKIALIRGMSIKQVERTSFVNHMESLVGMVETYKKMLKNQASQLDFQRVEINRFNDLFRQLENYVEMLKMLAGGNKK